MRNPAPLEIWQFWQSLCQSWFHLRPMQSTLKSVKRLHWLNVLGLDLWYYKTCSWINNVWSSTNWINPGQVFTWEYKNSCLPQSLHGTAGNNRVSVHWNTFPYSSKWKPAAASLYASLPSVSPSTGICNSFLNPAKLLASTAPCRHAVGIAWKKYFLAFIFNLIFRHFICYSLDIVFWETVNNIPYPSPTWRSLYHI